MAELTFAHVSKHFDSTPALLGLHLSVADGEFVAIVGSSGCGKSTALRIAAGLETADSGHIVVDGQVIDHVLARDRRFGLATQQNALVGHRTAEGNIALPLEVRMVHRKDINRRVRDEAKQFGVGHLLRRRRSQLSGGEVQAVQIARALVARPRVLLLDEPLARIDLELRHRLRTDLARIQREYGVTTVLVTADQEDAMVLSDRIALLDDGVLQQVGHPMDLYEQPVNTTVARFLGDPPMNLLVADVTGHDAGHAYDLAGQSVACRHRTAGHAGSRALLGVRPERLVLRSPEDESATLAVVSRTEPRGSHTILELSSDAIRDESGQPVTLKVSHRGFGARVGDRVGVWFDPESLHLFDLRTGAALGHAA